MVEKTKAPCNYLNHIVGETYHARTDPDDITD